MKMNYWKFAVLAMAVVALSFTSCSDDGNGGGGDEMRLHERRRYVYGYVDG